MQALGAAVADLSGAAALGERRYGALTRAPRLYLHKLLQQYRIALLYLLLLLLHEYLMNDLLVLMQPLRDIFIIMRT